MVGEKIDFPPSLCVQESRGKQCDAISLNLLSREPRRDANLRCYNSYVKSKAAASSPNDDTGGRHMFIVTYSCVALPGALEQQDLVRPPRIAA